MIAAVIIFGVLVGLLMSLSESQRLKMNTQETQLAMDSIRTQFEVLKDAEFDTLAATYDGFDFQVTGLNPLPASQDPDGQIGEITIDSSDPNLLVATVTLRWEVA